MKILFTDEYPIGLKNAFEENGFSVLMAPPKVLSVNESVDKIALLNSCNIFKEIDYLFTFDFDIYFADWCNVNLIKYISWSVDSPHLSLYSEFVNLETNRIFVFDYVEYTELLTKGKKNIYYLPLATDVNYLHKIATQNRSLCTKFSADVSFMGNMYDKNPHNLFDQITFLPQRLRGYLNALFEVQTRIWGLDLFRTEAFYLIQDELKKYVKLDFDNTYDIEIYHKFYDNMFGKKVAQIERKRICDYLASKYDFVLYSGSDTSNNPEIINRGYINYLTEMPIMFNQTKINININLHCISSGIPLRVLDIMACEGFCLTNYQAEIADFFDDKKEIVMFSDFEDMCAKIDYYLDHEEERKMIAHNGYLKVKKEFDYSIAIPKMVNLL